MTMQITQICLKLEKLNFAWSLLIDGLLPKLALISEYLDGTNGNTYFVTKEDQSENYMYELSFYKNEINHNQFKHSETALDAEEVSFIQKFNSGNFWVSDIWATYEIEDIISASPRKWSVLKLGESDEFELIEDGGEMIIKITYPAINPWEKPRSMRKELTIKMIQELAS
jgi:hypothetical protein